MTKRENLGLAEIELGEVLVGTFYRFCQNSVIVGTFLPYSPGYHKTVLIRQIKD